MKQYTLKITGEKKAPIQKGMFGLFYEDINYACDGGISAQMLENGSFEFKEGLGTWGGFSAREDYSYGWLPFPAQGDGGIATILCENPVNEVNPHYLHFTTSDTQNGFLNKAYDGVSLKAGAEYVVEAYLRSADYEGEVYASVLERCKEGEKQGIFVATQAVLAEAVTPEWTKYSITLKADRDVRHGKFVISLGKPYHAGDGSLMRVSTTNKKPVYTLDADFIVCKPADAACGVFRKDIVDLLKGMQPGFLRFPGGCIVEGCRLSNRYEWKKTVGPREGRKHDISRWALHFNSGEDEFATNRFSHYNQSFDIGYYEYFLLCEYIGAKPLPVQNVGVACQYQTEQNVAPETPEFEEFVQDVLDLIEFANGDVTTKWGALRASMGHPESFGLEMVGIGNEQWETEDVQFFKRYELFEKAIHAVYPEIKLNGSAGPDVTSEHYTDAWAYYREKIGEKPDFAYALDEHYYNPIPWFYENTHFYDDYRRDIKVFAGEYAAHTSWEDDHMVKNCLDAALGEAAFLTGVQKNSDVVVLTSYAPLFARVGYTQWSPNLIWFDDKTAYGSPNYYIQKLYALNPGTVNIEAYLENGEENRLYQAVSLDEETGEYILKLVNGSDEAVAVKIESPTEVKGFFKSLIEKIFGAKGGFNGRLKAIVVSGDSRSTVNTVENPTAVCDREVILEPTEEGYILPALSCTMIRV